MSTKQRNKQAIADNMLEEDLDKKPAAASKKEEEKKKRTHQRSIVPESRGPVPHSPPLRQHQRHLQMPDSDDDAITAQPNTVRVTNPPYFSSLWNPTSEVAKQTAAKRTRSTTKYEDTVAPTRPTAASLTSMMADDFKDSKKKAAPKKKKGTRLAVDYPLHDSAVWSGEESSNTRADIETGIVLYANEQSPSLLTPQLGAIAVDGIDSSDDDYSIADPSTTPQPTASSDVQEIAATLVDQDEEARKRQELVNKEVEKKLEEERERAEVADVVTGIWCSPRIKRFIALGVSLVVLLGIAAIVLGTVLPQVLEPPPPTMAPTSAPPTNPPTLTPTSPLPGLVELLSSVSLDGGVALETLETPQNNALNWLANNNTNLNDYSDERKIQRYVLATLYYSTNGDNWTISDDWLSDSDECGWYNDAKSCSNGSVVDLSFVNNNLVGTIPVELALLSNSVATVNIWWNHLTGTIPSEIALMTNLNTLSLLSNDLTGTIPTEIALMTNLSILWLNNNTFSGDFTCPDFITVCFISCFDEKVFQAVFNDDETILQELNSTCRTL